MFSGIQQFAMIGGAALVLGAYIYVNDLRHDKDMLSAKVDNLEQTVRTLNSAIETQKKETERMQRDWMENQVEIEKLREKDKASRAEVAELSRKINSAEKKAQLERVSGGKKASLHLRLVNKGAACEWTHIDDFSGECNNTGQWKENHNE